MHETPSFRNEFNDPVDNLIQGNIQNIHYHPEASMQPPNEVAAEVRGWVNHDSTLDWLVDRCCDDPRYPALIWAPPGLGSSALIGVAAKRLRSRFPGGQVLIRIGPDGDTDAAMRQFLERRDKRALLPSGDGDPRPLFRAELDGEPLMLVVDGVKTREEAEYFSTGLPNVAYVVVSKGIKRWHAAECREMPTLSVHHAKQLLARNTGLGNDDIDSLVAGFGPRPKTLFDAAAILENQQAAGDITAEELVSMAGDDEQARLFLRAFENLDTESQVLHRALLAIGSSDIEKELLDVLDAEDSRLARLRSSRLIVDSGRGAWRLRTGAESELRKESFPEAVRLDVRRVLGWYLRRAQLADSTLVAERTRVGIPEPVECPGFEDQGHARRWFAANRRALVRLLKVADLLGWRRETWSIADALWLHYATGEHRKEALHCYEIAERAAAGEARAQTRMKQMYGKLLTDDRDWAAAGTVLDHAYEMAEGTADPVLIGTSLEFIGRLLYKSGSVEDSIPWLRRGEANARERGDTRTIGLLTRFLGEAYRELADYGMARRNFVESLACFQTVGDDRSIAIVSLEVAILEAVQHSPDARLRFEEAMLQVQEQGMVRHAAHGYRRFALLRAEPERRRYLEAALKIYEAIGDAAADDVRRELG